MNDTTQIIIKSPLKRKIKFVFFASIPFILCVSLVINNVQMTKRLDETFGNPDSGVTSWRYDDAGNYVNSYDFLSEKQKEELYEIILLTIFFGLILFIFLFQTRIVCVIDREGITRPRFLGRKFHKKIVWKNIKNISTTIQLVKTKHSTVKVEYLCISLKDDIETEKQSLLKQLIEGLNNKLLKVNNVDIFIPLFGVSGESVIEKIRPYIQESQLTQY